MAVMAHIHSSTSLPVFGFVPRNNVNHAHFNCTQSFLISGQKVPFFSSMLVFRRYDHVYILHGQIDIRS